MGASRFVGFEQASVPVWRGQTGLAMALPNLRNPEIPRFLKFQPRTREGRDATRSSPPGCGHMRHPGGTSCRHFAEQVCILGPHGPLCFPAGQVGVGLPAAPVHVHLASGLACDFGVNSTGHPEVVGRGDRPRMARGSKRCFFGIRLRMHWYSTGAALMLHCGCTCTTRCCTDTMQVLRFCNCCAGAALVLRWYGYGTALVLDWHYAGTLPALHKYSTATSMAPCWYCCGTALALQCYDTGTTLVLCGQCVCIGTSALPCSSNVPRYFWFLFSGCPAFHRNRARSPGGLYVINRHRARVGRSRN